MGLKIILTGVTGMVGEGVLFECLHNPAVESVLVIGRRHYELQHLKLRELLVPDFSQLDTHAAAIAGNDACFFCAGISSIGLNEERYTDITYTTTMAFARSVLAQNPGLVFTYVSGAGTDSTAQGRLMWARVKGRTENELAALPFKAEYNFRPGVMQPFPEQHNWKPVFKLLVKIIRLLAPGKVITLQELGRAMIHAATRGYPKNILEVKDIKALAKA